MTFTYKFYDDQQVLLFTMPFMDRTLRMDDLFIRDGVKYKVESVLLIMDTTNNPQGLDSDYARPVAEVVVSVVP